MLLRVNYDEYAANSILHGSNLTKIIILFDKTVNERAARYHDWAYQECDCDETSVLNFREARYSNLFNLIN